MNSRQAARKAQSGSYSRHLALGLGATLILALCAPVGRAQGSWPYLSEVRSLLSEPGQEEAFEQLQELGPRAAQTLWAVSAGRAHAEAGIDLRTCEGLIRENLSSWPAEQVVGELLDALESDTPLTEQLIAVKLLSWTDSDEGLHGILELLASVEPLQLRSHWVAIELDHALDHLLSSDPNRLRILADELEELPEELTPFVVAAVGDIPRPEVALVFSRAARMGPALLRAVLSEIADNERVVPDNSRYELLALAKSHLADRAASTRLLAIAAVGRLGGMDSFEALIGLLDDDDPSVRRVALKALQQISRIERTWSAEQWRVWQTGEEAWLEQSSSLVRKMLSRDLHQAKVAVREVASHPAFADEVAELLEEGLRHQDSGVRRIACEGLVGMAHSAAVPALIGALEDADLLTRVKARLALRNLTGVDMGKKRWAWENWWHAL